VVAALGCDAPASGPQGRAEFGPGPRPAADPGRQAGPSASSHRSANPRLVGRFAPRPGWSCAATHL